MSQPQASCSISMRGSFDVHWADYLGDTLLRVEVVEGQIRTTTLFGKPPDLSAFIGMLSLLADLGFPVVECEYHCAEVSKGAASSSGSGIGSASVAQG